MAIFEIKEYVVHSDSRAQVEVTGYIETEKTLGELVWESVESNSGKNYKQITKEEYFLRKAKAQKILDMFNLNI